MGSGRAAFEAVEGFEGRRPRWTLMHAVQTAPDKSFEPATAGFDMAGRRLTFSPPLSDLALPRASAPSVSIEAIEPGVELDGQFVVVERIGRGGFGEVWKVRRISNGTVYALKMMSDAYHGDTRVERQFEYEWKLLQQMSGGSGFIPHVEVHTIRMAAGDFRAIVMTYYPYTLDSWVKQRYPSGVPWRDLLRILDEVLEPIVRLHEHGEGCVHRDVKPKNIFIDEHGRCVLGDFGIARPVDRSQTTAIVAADLIYSAPEQLGSDSRTKAADVYSVGMVMCFLLRGADPTYPGEGCDGHAEAGALFDRFSAQRPDARWSAREASAALRQARAVVGAGLRTGSPVDVAPTAVVRGVEEPAGRYPPPFERVMRRYAVSCVQSGQNPVEGWRSGKQVSAQLGGVRVVFTLGNRGYGTQVEFRSESERARARAVLRGSSDAYRAGNKFRLCVVDDEQFMEAWELAAGMKQPAR